MILAISLILERSADSRKEQKKFWEFFFPHTSEQITNKYQAEYKFPWGTQNQSTHVPFFDHSNKFDQLLSIGEKKLFNYKIGSLQFPEQGDQKNVFL